MLQPLAERMRPQYLSDYIGQSHIIGTNSVLRIAIEQKQIPSLILWGPPGVGKTTLAGIIAHETQLPFVTLSAISSGVKDIRETIQQAKEKGHIILFIDEVHRFNKSQQDALLGAVEKGIITLIGATTENPSFEVNSALLSRCQVYVLQALTPEESMQILKHSMQHDVWLKQLAIELKETDALFQLSGGDARKLLNLFEIVVQQLSTQQPIVILNTDVIRIAQQRVALYDKHGEQHYDIISAFIKSMRGSDPNAAVYWLARMIAGGEDIKFIARRMVIFASEDIGIANPNALLLANATFDAVRNIGYPEGRIILSQCAVYLATSPKSNASYMAIEEALACIRETGDLPVPLPIRNGVTGLMKAMDYGKNYVYDHHHEGNFAGQEFLPEGLHGKKLYDPGRNAKEEEIRRWLTAKWKDKYNY